MTGAASGIGLTLSEQLARRGALVTLVDIACAPVEEAAAALASAGFRVRPAVVDVTDRAAVKQLVESAVSEFGRLDYLFNNAAIGVGGLLRPVLQQLARIFPELPVPMTTYIDLKLEPVRNMGNARDVLYWDPLLVPFVRLKTMASLGSEKLARPVEEIDIPVMMLQAERDTIFPTDYIEKVYARLNCEKSLKVYPGLPHYMIVDHVDQILDDVLEWIEHICSTGERGDS